MKRSTSNSHYSQLLKSEDASVLLRT